MSLLKNIALRLAQDTEEEFPKISCTRRPIKYFTTLGSHITIPAGTKIVPATNLPVGGYWAEPWKDMSELEESWARNYGFHLTEDQVTDSE